MLFGIIIYINLADKHGTIEVENKVATTTVEVLPDWAQDEDAKAAAQAVLRKKELEAELESLTVERQAIQDRIDEVERELGTYWKGEGNIKALIREVFHDVPATAVAVATAESQLRMIQSREIYPFTDTRRGIYAGQTERSYCIFQIHAPDHDATAQQLGYGDYRTNVESCVKMARYLYERRGHTFNDWSVYKNGSYLAYLR